MRWRDLIGGRGTVRGHPNGRFNHRTIKRDEWLKRQRAGVAVSLILFLFLFLFHCNDPSKLIYRPGFVSVTFPRVRGLEFRGGQNSRRGWKEENQMNEKKQKSRGGSLRRWK